jgi:hypothetical protein
VEKRGVYYECTNHTLGYRRLTMKSQIAKRININLTQKQVDELKYIEAHKTGDKYMDSDIVRDAIDMFAQILGYSD